MPSGDGYYLIVCVCKRAFGHLRTSVQSPRTHNILFRHSSTAKHNHPTVDKTSGSSLHGRDALLHVRRAPAHPNGSTRIAPPPPHTTGGKRSRATGLNCLSAECSIERVASWRSTTRRGCPGLNCLSAECSIERLVGIFKTGALRSLVSIAFRLNARLKGSHVSQQAAAERVQVSIAFRLNARLKALVAAGQLVHRAVHVSIAFRLNARLKAWRTSSESRAGPRSLNCLSAECSIERWFMRQFHTGKISNCLNCLSAECSIERGARSSPTPTRATRVSIAFRLNARLKGRRPAPRSSSGGSWSQLPFG